MRFVRVAAALCLLWPSAACAADVTVFAAASMKGALDEALSRWDGAATVSYAGSSALARQIDQGAPADIVISASPDWMDWLAARGLLRPGTRRDLLGNRLALVGYGPQTAAPIDQDFDLAARLGDGRLAMALVDSVPAGVYGKAALGTLGLWDGVKDHVAQTDNVRAALALVARGEAPLGVVYATDAAAEPGVGLIGLFPEDSHPPILYPAAIVADSAAPRAAEALAFLSGAEAQAIFAAHGFSPKGGE